MIIKLADIHVIAQYYIKEIGRGTNENDSLSYAVHGPIPQIGPKHKVMAIFLAKRSY